VVQIGTLCHVVVEAKCVVDVQQECKQKLLESTISIDSNCSQVLHLPRISFMFPKKLYEKSLWGLDIAQPRATFFFFPNKLSLCYTFGSKAKEPDKKCFGKSSRLRMGVNSVT
jgi:hypothetical protein